MYIYTKYKPNHYIYLKIVYLESKQIHIILKCIWSIHQDRLYCDPKIQALPNFK